MKKINQYKNCYFKCCCLSSVLLILSFVSEAQLNGYGNKVDVAAKVRHRINADQVTYDNYKYFPTLLVDSIQNFEQEKPQLDLYGGDASKTIAEKGFFRVKKTGERWWCIDPEGHPYINIAVNSINMGKSDRNKAAFAKKFKTTDRWMDATVNMMHEFGFNSAGSWSDATAITTYNKTARTPLVYTINWNFMNQYGIKRGGTYQAPGHRGYPGNAIFVFDPEFEKFCDSLAKQLAAYKDDKNLFGYFSDNEMPFSENNLEGYLSLPENDPGHVAAMAWLTRKGLSPKAITSEIKKEFLAFVANRYFSIISKAIKKYDPNHLYIGCRFYSSEKNIPEFMQVAGQYLDIISINYYGAWTPSAATMNNWTAWSGKPFIVTEYYVKGEDSGLPNTSGAGWIVKTQDDRGKFYQNFCMGLLQSNNCVGWHWFKYQDNDPLQKNAEPSNTDANKGLVNYDYSVYKPMAERMKKLNDNSYALIKYFQNNQIAKTNLDLYLLIGQSNMAGRGIITDEYKKESNEQVLMLDKENNWMLARHPLHFDKPSVAGVGPGLSFGISMAENNNGHQVGLIPCAVGGTSINVWKPGGYDEATKTHPYDDMLFRLKEAQKNGTLKGVIWLQGESDSNPEKAYGYLDKLQELIERIRKEAGDNSLPFVAGELGKYKEQYATINDQLKQLTAKVKNAAVASSEGFTDKGDNTHFDSSSAEEFGKRFAKKMKQLQKKIK